MKTLKDTLVPLLLIVFFLSCNDLEESEILESPKDTYHVTISNSSNLIKAKSERAMNAPDSSISELTYSLNSEDCLNIETKAYDSSEIPTIFELPQLTSGTYYFSIRADGNNNLRFYEYIDFTIESDTTLDAEMNAYQSRYKISNLSQDTLADFNYVKIGLNSSQHNEYNEGYCEDYPPGWYNQEYEYSWESTHMYPFKAHEYFYTHELFIHSLSFNFYDSEFNILAYITIDLDESFWMLDGMGYNFEVDINEIWSGLNSENNLPHITLTWTEEEWEEEIISVN